jgi:hypothetical protein
LLLLLLLLLLLWKLVVSKWLNSGEAARLYSPFFLTPDLHQVIAHGWTGLMKQSEAIISGFLGPGRCNCTCKNDICDSPMSASITCQQ